MLCFYKLLLTGMTTKVYPIQYQFVSLAYLVFPPLKTRFVWVKEEKGGTLLTNKVYPTCYRFLSLVLLASKPLNTLKPYLLRKSALLFQKGDHNDQQGLLCPPFFHEPSFARIYAFKTHSI